MSRGAAARLDEGPGVVVPLRAALDAPTPAETLATLAAVEGLRGADRHAMALALFVLRAVDRGRRPAAIRRAQATLEGALAIVIAMQGEP